MENGMEMKIIASREDLAFGNDRIRLFGIRYDYITGHKQRFHIMPLQFEEHKTNEQIFPFITIEREEAQKLMDSLWDCGLRPSEGTGSAGAMLAVQKHLQDMRVIVYETLKIQESARKV